MIAALRRALRALRRVQAAEPHVSGLDIAARLVARRASEQRSAGRDHTADVLEQLVDELASMAAANTITLDPYTFTKIGARHDH